MTFKALKISLILNLIDRSEIIIWSDANLLNNNNEDIFIEISSLNKNVQDDKIIEIIDTQLPLTFEENYENKTHIFIINKIFNTIEDWKNIQKKLLDYYELNANYLDQENFEYWSRIKDDFHLRKEGFTGCMRMPRELFEYYQKFKCEEVSKPLSRLNIS